MPGGKQPIEADFEQMRSDLSEGLKACHAVVRGYRELMDDDSGAATAHPPPDDHEPPTANDRA